MPRCVSKVAGVLVLRSANRTNQPAEIYSTTPELLCIMLPGSTNELLFLPILHLALLDDDDDDADDDDDDEDFNAAADAAIIAAVEIVNMYICIVYTCNASQ